MTQEKYDNYKQIIRGNNLDDVILYWDDKLKYMTDNDGENLLHNAVRYDVKLEIIEFLIKKIEINEVNRNGKTPLNIAAEAGYTDIAKLLIQNGAYVRIKDVFGYTSLHLAAVNGCTDIAKLLIQHGADLSIKDNIGRTPLHIAAADGHTDIAKLLIQHGADLSIKDVFGETPLHRAADAGCTDIVKLLIQHGADLSIKDIVVASKSTKFTSKQRKEVSLPAVSKPAKITEQKKRESTVKVQENKEDKDEIKQENKEDKETVQKKKHTETSTSTDFVTEDREKLNDIRKAVNENNNLLQNFISCFQNNNVNELLPNLQQSVEKQQNKEYDDSKYFDGQDPKFLDNIWEFLKEIYEQKKRINISLPILADVIESSVEYLKDKLNTGSLSDSLDDYAKKISNIFYLATNIFSLYKCERRNKDNKLVSTPRLTNILNQQLKMCQYIQKDECYSSSNIKQRLMQAILYCVSNHLLLIVHNPNLLHVLDWMDVLEHVLDDEHLKKLTRVLGALNLGHIYSCKSDISKKKETRIKTVLNPVKVALDNDSFEIEYPGISKDFVKVLIDNNDS